LLSKSEAPLTCCNKILKSEPRIFARVAQPYASNLHLLSLQSQNATLALTFILILRKSYESQPPNYYTYTTIATMDFASLMSREISKSKPQKSSASNTSPNSNPNSTQPTSKYTKRADLEAARLSAYDAEQESIRQQREAKAAQKRKFEEEEAERKREREEKKRRLAEESRKKREEEEEARERARRRRLGLPEVVKEADNEAAGEGEEDVSDEVLIEKLRGLGEPARLFGETHRGRLRRWRRLEREKAERKQLSDGPIPTSLELVGEKDMKVPGTVPKDEEGRKFLFRQLASYFTMVLREWEVALDRREEAVKLSFQGKQAYGAMVQSRENMRPLFKKFERAELEDGILEPVVEIVKAAQERRYVDANDGYLRLSIGKA
jgi:pre-mRNA-splicing factor 18